MAEEVAIAEEQPEVKQTEKSADLQKIKKVGITQAVKNYFNVDAYDQLDAVAKTEPTPTEIEEEISEPTSEETKPEPNTEPQVEQPTEPIAEAKNEIDQDALKAYFEKNGIDFESIDQLKEKLKPKEVLSPEDIQKQKLSAEKRYVDLFVEGGGTVEQYVAIKNIAEKPLSELSLAAVKQEYKDMGFSDEEVSDIINERYYQGITDEDIDALEDTDKEFSKKLKEVFSKKLENKAAYKQQQAQKILADLKQSADDEDLQVENEKALSSKIDDIFKQTPRKVTFEIGESNGKPILPINYEVSDSDLDEVRSMLKDPTERNKFLTNDDGSLNVSNLANVLLRNKMLEKAIKLTYLESQNRAAELVESIYPSKQPFEVGIGGAVDKVKFAKNQVAGVGKSKRV